VFPGQPTYQVIRAKVSSTVERPRDFTRDSEDGESMRTHATSGKWNL
jgi:hypothetical protein